MLKSSAPGYKSYGIITLTDKTDKRISETTLKKKTLRNIEGHLAEIKALTLKKIG